MIGDAYSEVAIRGRKAGVAKTHTTPACLPTRPEISVLPSSLLAVAAVLTWQSPGAGRGPRRLYSASTTGQSPREGSWRQQPRQYAHRGSRAGRPGCPGPTHSGPRCPPPAGPGERGGWALSWTYPLPILGAQAMPKKRNLKIFKLPDVSQVPQPGMPCLRAFLSCHRLPVLPRVLQTRPPGAGP